MIRVGQLLYLNSVVRSAQLLIPDEVATAALTGFCLKYFTFNKP